MTPEDQTVLLVLAQSGQGGMQGVVATLAQALADAGRHVHLAVGAGPPMPAPFTEAARARPSAIQIHELPAPTTTSGRLGWLRGISGVIGTVRPSIVHGHGMRTAWPLALVSRRNPRNVLVTCHGLPPSSMNRTCRLVRASGVTVGAVGPGLESDLRARGVRTRLLANGVGAAPDPVDKHTFMTSVGLDPSRPLVVSPARLSPQKDPLTLLDAIVPFEDVALVYVGDGPLEHQVRSAIDERSLSNRVVLTGWRDDARALLGAADVVAMSSRWEGQALVMMEAAAAGVPLVATSCPGVIEWLHDGDDALLAPVGDATALGRAIDRALHDAALRDRLVHGGLRLADEHSIDAMLTSHLTLYAELAR